MIWTVMLEKTLESPLDCKDIQSVHPKGDQSWVFIGRTDVEAETPILWPPDVKNWLNGKDPHAGKDWRQEEKGTTEDEMVGWHHRLNGHGSGWTLGVGDGQGGLVCWGSWDHKESDTTERLNWTDDGLCSVSKLCLTLCHPMDCIAHQAPLSIRIFQARILELVAISSSRGSFRPRDGTHVSCITCTCRQILYH